MAVYLTCCSHSPLMLVEGARTGAAEQAGFLSTMAQVSAELHDFAPDLVVVFAPDHFNGFFYDLMPSFCIGAAAEGTQDWGIEGGPLRVPRELALACVRDLHRQSIDIAISYAMRVDHGATISLLQLTGGLARYPVLPVFINCAADPRPTLQRARVLGSAIGRFLAATGQRVAVIGSGGLSHDPPTPRLATTSAAIATRLIHRATPTRDELAAREARVLRLALELADGGGPCMPPDVQWDASFLSHVVAYDTVALDAIDDDELDRHAGFGGHEVRTWVAARAAADALASAATPPVALAPDIRFYAAIPAWMTGMGIVTAHA